jgi:hypothetical protein
MLRQLIAVLLFSALLIGNAHAQVCQALTNFDFNGAATSIDIGFINNVFSSDQCCSQCVKRLVCQAWTYVPAVNTCYLKTGTGSISYSIIFN